MAVTVRHGVNSVTLDNIGGRTVGEVREELAGLFNIPQEAQVRVNGAADTDDRVIPDGASVEFVKVAGEKGAWDA